METRDPRPELEYEAPEITLIGDVVELTAFPKDGSGADWCYKQEPGS